MMNQQVFISEFGAASVLTLESSPIPSPKAGEVLVKVAFAAVNPIDVKTRAGLGWAAEQNKDNLPWVPGYDLSGTVVEVGEEVDEFSAGMAVAGMVGFPLQGGAYSQYLCVSAKELTPVPNSITLEAAAALPLAGQTAAQAVQKAQIKEGDHVLILAGAGGVGHIAVQLAVAAKAQVYASCSEANLGYLAQLGAHAINYQFAPMSERLEKIDVLIDLMGGEVALDALKCLADGAKVVTVPTASASLVNEKAQLLGFHSQGFLVEPDPKQLATLFYMVSVGLLKVDIQRVYPLHEVVQAHLDCETQRTRGKIILQMPS